MNDFELELKKDFLLESEDLLDAAEDTFLQLESDGSDPELLNEIFRLAHNLKGTSKAVGFDQLSEFTHIAENLILKLKEGELAVTEVIVTTLLSFKDKVAEMISGLKDDIDATFDLNADLEALQSLINNEQPAVEAMTEENHVVEDSSMDSFEDLSAEVDAIPSADLFPDEDEEIEQAFTEDTSSDDICAGGVSDAAIESLKELGIDCSEFVQAVEADKLEPQETAAVENIVENNVVDLAPVAQAKTEEVAARPEAKAEKKKDTAKKSVSSDETVRVKLERIDQLNNIVGELVILQTVVTQRRYEYIRDDISNKSIGMMDKLFKEVQELSMSLRMLPLKNTFQKMTRIVRDTSKALDKNVKLSVVGEETEVDKTVLEKLADPLVHIIRNAVDHGLETKEERAMSGKEEVGTVELLAFHEGSNLVIQVTDDGKGIDPEKIKKKAIERGIITANSLLGPSELIQLVFHPGFSTKEQVTEVSGRGVGMDVVKTNIESLGGEVKVMSKMGEGSSFRIVLPLTLAIIEGMVIKSDEQKFVIPLSQVFELTRGSNKDIEKFTGSAELFKLRGEVIPLFHINKKLGAKVEESDKKTIIVVRGLSRAFGVVVDDIINQQQVVIKKLGEDIQNRKGFMGSSIMSDGKPAIILDMFELFKDDLKESQAYKELRENQRVA